MSKIYELFGYPVTDTSEKVKALRSQAYCPFIADKCDGGGNRYMSEFNLAEHAELKELFPGMDRVPSGVCSIQLSDNTSPWIICPRRLLYMGQKANTETLHGDTQLRLLEKCGFPRGATIGIWAEAKVKYTTEEDENSAAFDYTFDYILMPLGRVSKDEAVELSGTDWATLQRQLNENGHTFSMRDGDIAIEDFPVGSPVIVEVMTSSTSGGNKRKRSCIPQSFEDCMLGKPHVAPGINYRQVWARMASQLIVKSQAAIEWNGKTIWVLQDLLAEYISKSTALDLHKFISEHTDEVNILAFAYDKNYNQTTECETVSLEEPVLYSGPIRNGNSNQPCFQDIVLASICPPRKVLIAALCKKPLANRLSL